MSKRPHIIAQNGLTSVNLQSALNRVPPAGSSLQKGLTAANLQAALANSSSSSSSPSPSPTAGNISNGSSASK